MRSLPSNKAKGVVLAYAFILGVLTPTTATHPTGKCLDQHINAARMLVGDYPAANFDPQVIADHFKRDTVEPGLQIQTTKVEPSDVEIYYSSSSSNTHPIITMKNGKLSAVRAIAIKNGKVKATGSLFWIQILTGRNPTFRDLGSKVMLPGFVEPHLHILLSAMLKGYVLDISPLKAPTFIKAIEQLKGHLTNVNPGEWLVAYGYDPSRTGWQDLLKDELDSKVSATVPILILNASGHIAYVNSKAFEVAGINKTSPQPEGGELVHDADGELTGVAIEQSAISIFAAKAIVANKAQQTKIPAGIAAILGQWLSKGVTTAFDAGLGTTSPEEFCVISNLTDTSPIRLHAAVSNFSPGQAEKYVGTGKMPDGGFKSGNLTIRTIKLFNDGSTQGFTAGVNENFLDTHYPDYFHGTERKGLLIWPDQNSNGSQYNVTLHDEMLKWMKRGYQIMVHSNGDRSTDVVLDTFAATFKKYPKFKRMMHRIEHFTVSQTSQIIKAKILGLGLSHTMGHVHFWGDTFRDNVIGQDRAFRVGPINDDRKYGVTFSFNSDSPLTDVDPLLWVKTAITRETYYNGTTLGKEQKVGLETALNGVTNNPAKQILRGDEVGTLEPGKKADFIILNEDIRNFDFQNTSLSRLEILETWVGGQRKYLRVK